MRDFYIKEGQVQARYLPLLFFGFALTAAFAHGLWMLNQGNLNVGELVAYMGLMGVLRFPIFISIFTFSLVQLGLAGAERILDLMSEETELDENLAGHAGTIGGEIVFDDVSFGFGNTLDFGFGNTLDFGFGNTLDFCFGNTLDFGFGNTLDFGMTFTGDEVTGSATLYNAVEDLPWPSPIRPTTDWYFYMDVDLSSQCALPGCASTGAVPSDFLIPDFATPMFFPKVRTRPAVPARTAEAS